jgi:hypothetical protein
MMSQVDKARSETYRRLYLSGGDLLSQKSKQICFLFPSKVRSGSLTSAVLITPGDLYGS